MMNDFAGSYSVTRPSTMVDSIFRRHNEKLYTQRKEFYRSIDDWTNGLITQVRDHASKQRQLVDKFFNDRQHYLDDLREQYLASSIYGRLDDTEDISRLIEKCKSLNVELGKINFSSRDTEFIDIIPTEPREQIDEEITHIRQTSGNSIEGSSVKKNDVNPMHNDHLNSTSYSTLSTITSSSSDRFNQGLRTNQSSSNNYSSAYNDEDPITKPNNNDNSADKCPICYMIFSSSMSQYEREVHTDAHLKNE